MSFINTMKERRIKLGISQAKLAKKLGYGTAQVVSNFERGQSKLPLKKMSKLCAALKVPKSKVADLLISEYVESVKQAMK